MGGKGSGDRTLSDEERFWNKVIKLDGFGCWLWDASCHHDGYGAFSVRVGSKRKPKRAHRYSMELHLGRELLPDEHILHYDECPIICVRPEHLRVGTDAQNKAETRGKGHRGGKHLDSVARAAIRAEYGRGQITHLELGQKYGVHRHTVAGILKDGS